MSAKPQLSRKAGSNPSYSRPVYLLTALCSRLWALVGTMGVVYPSGKHLFGYVILISLVHSAVAAAEIYRWKDDEGNVIYSDVPQPGAEKVELNEPIILPAQPVPGSSSFSRKRKEKPPAKPYESVSITRPADEQTIRDNIADINVAISVRPALQAGFGHQLQLLFDGQRVGKPGRKMSFVLPGVDRGAHTLEAVILDRNGQVAARSPITTFFVHKISILHRGP